MAEKDGDSRHLGLDQAITRRDFIGGALLGSGALLLGMPAPVSATQSSDKLATAWNGYAGTGDYARSNGNTYQVRENAHLIRDGKIDEMLHDVVDLGESHDVIVVGGGFSGTGAARTFLREARKGQSCLVLENHALSGGEAKRNEFVVDGYRLVGPQGSNLVSPPQASGDWYDDLWSDLGIPRKPVFRSLAGERGRQLRVPRDNFYPMFMIGDQITSTGYYFDSATFGGKSYWDVDSHRTGFRNTAFPEAVQSDLRRLSAGLGRNLGGTAWEQWLDGMSYASYLENVLGIRPETSALLDPALCLEGGLGADSLSALFAARVGAPGFMEGFPGDISLYRATASTPEEMSTFSFPGGNDGVYRLLLKRVIPEAIEGGTRFEEVHDGRYRFENFDRPGHPVRIRLNSTVVQVRQNASTSGPPGVEVVYRRDGKLYRVRGAAVVSSVGGWVAKHVVKELPEDYQAAFDQLTYGSAVIINVALRNWRFLEKLGVTSAISFMKDGLGQCMNIRRPMVFGEHQAPFDPDKPIVLTSYVGFSQRGLPARAQAAMGRGMLLSRSYRDYEIMVRRQLTEMFASAGFDARRDITGIVVNRWGHSYVVPEPGFYFGLGGRPAPSQILKQRLGRIAFGHSELNGIQEWFGGVENGERAMRQVLATL